MAKKSKKNRKKKAEEEKESFRPTILHFLRMLWEIVGRWFHSHPPELPPLDNTGELPPLDNTGELQEEDDSTPTPPGVDLNPTRPGNTDDSNPTRPDSEDYSTPTPPDNTDNTGDKLQQASDPPPDPVKAESPAKDESLANAESLLFLKHHGGSTFSIKESPSAFHINHNNSEFPVDQLARKYKSTLHAYTYYKTLREYLDEMNGGNRGSLKEVFIGSDYKKLLPREWARELAAAVLNAYIELGSEPHFGLDLIDNYVVYKRHRHPYRNNAVFGRNWDYEDPVVVRIIHNLEAPESKADMADMDEKAVKMSRNLGVSRIIFNEIFQNADLDGEWDDFRRGLEKGKLYYCQQHPVLKHWEKRLLAFVKLSNTIGNKTQRHTDVIYDAITECAIDELYTETWDVARLAKHQPLQDVKNFHVDSAPDPKRSRDTWVEACSLIKFISNCYRHLTEGSWKTTTKVYNVQIAKGSKNEQEYRQLRFLDHLIRYFVYPGLFVALYRQLFKCGYELF